MIVCVCVENPRKSTKNTSRASVVGIVGHYQIPVISAKYSFLDKKVYSLLLAVNFISSLSAFV